MQELLLAVARGLVGGNNFSGFQILLHRFLL